MELKEVELTKERKGGKLGLREVQRGNGNGNGNGGKSGNGKRRLELYIEVYVYVYVYMRTHSKCVCVRKEKILTELSEVVAEYSSQSSFPGLVLSPPNSQIRKWSISLYLITFQLNK